MNVANLLDPARVEIKLGDYGVAPASALHDSSWLMAAQDYRRQASARMYPLDPKEINQRIPSAKFHVSRKLDGEFTVLLYRDEQLVTVNPGGTVRCGLPWQDEAARLLKQAGLTEAMIAGELYVRHEDGRRARVHDIVSWSRNPRSEEELGQICFAAFDTISWNGDAPPADFFESFQQLESVLAAGDLVNVVPSVVVDKSSEVEAKFREWVVDDGAEGLVVRSESAGHFKVKPRHNLDVAVVGFTESTGDRQGMLHDLLIAVRRKDGTFQILGRVGGGFSDDERREFLADLSDLVVSSEYAEVNSDRVAYHMVAPEWVIEISCLDLIAQTTRGGPVNRMALDYDEAREPRYQVVRRLPLAAVISPQFVRKREDKTSAVSYVSIHQIGKQVDLPMAEHDARELTLSKSEVIQREVYYKELKGQTMVRKFVLWQTNKHEQSDEYPAFVLHYTDFSPNRKTPLAREIRVSNSREQIEAFWKEFKQDNVKSGWQPATVPEVASGADSGGASTPAASPVELAPSKTKPAKKTSKKAAKKSSAQEEPAAADEKKSAAKKKAAAKGKTSAKKTKAAPKKETAPKKKAAAKKLAASGKPVKKKGKKKSG